jgi:hypothetical protein
MKYELFAGLIDQTVNVFIRDATSSVGAGKTGLVYNTSGLSCYYCRHRAAAAVLNLATLAAVDSAHSDGGFKEIDTTNMPGMYRLDLSDAICAIGSPSAVVMLKGDSLNIIPDPIEIVLAPTFSAGSVSDSGAAAGDFDTDLTESANDHWNGTYCRFVTGTLKDQVRKVTDYTGSSKNLAFSDPFTASPANGDKFVLINR